MAEQVDVLIVTAPGSSFTLDSDACIETLAQLRLMHAQVPLIRFEFRIVAESDPVEFEYQIRAVDGRTWDQLLTMDVVGDPAHTFDVPAPGWRLSEYQYQRRPRDIMVQAASSMGLTRFRVRWEVV